METRSMETRSIKTRSMETRSIKTRSMETRSIKTRSIKTRIKTRSIKSKSDSLMSHDAVEADQLGRPVSFCCDWSERERPAKLAGLSRKRNDEKAYWKQIGQQVRSNRTYRALSPIGFQIK